MPDLSRRMIIALMAVVAGLAVVILALVGGSGSTAGGTRTASSDRPIKPVAPIDPKDKDAKGVQEKKDVSDVADPFAASFGASAKRKVSVRVSANGPVHIGLFYRDRKKPRILAAASFAETRTIKGRFPLSAIAIQLPAPYPGAATRATCTIVVDGIEVASETANKRGVIKTCYG